jgi:hypothetical protein
MVHPSGAMKDVPPDDVERYREQLRSELDMISSGPVLAGPRIIEHIGALLTLLDLHRPNDFDICASCDRLWPCPTVILIVGLPEQDAGTGTGANGARVTGARAADVGRAVPTRRPDYSEPSVGALASFPDPVGGTGPVSPAPRSWEPAGANTLAMQPPAPVGDQPAAGAHRNGAYANGAQSNGTYPNGANPDGTYPNGHYPDGAYPNGTYASGAYPDGRSPAPQANGRPPAPPPAPHPGSRPPPTPAGAGQPYAREPAGPPGTNGYRPPRPPAPERRRETGAQPPTAYPGPSQSGPPTAGLPAAMPPPPPAPRRLERSGTGVFAPADNHLGVRPDGAGRSAPNGPGVRPFSGDNGRSGPSGPDPGMARRPVPDNSRPVPDNGRHVPGNGRPASGNGQPRPGAAPVPSSSRPLPGDLPDLDQFRDDPEYQKILDGIDVI